jgi:hypothetical protein
MPFKHISDVEGLPVIGERYWVPCVTAKNQLTGGLIKNVPVIGTIHQDKFYFGVEWKHLHFDIRFVTGPVQRWLCKDVPTGAPEHSWLGWALHDADIDKQYERLMPCIRQMPVLPWEQCGEGMAELLQQKLGADKRKLSKCNRCPHRGTPLNGMQVSSKGIVVCPAHGLAFNVNTREMVVRSDKEPYDTLV